MSHRLKPTEMESSVSDQEANDTPEKKQEPYAKPKLHTHEPLRDLTGGGPFGPIPFPSPPTPKPDD